MVTKLSVCGHGVSCAGIRTNSGWAEFLTGRQSGRSAQRLTARVTTLDLSQDFLAAYCLVQLTLAHRVTLKGSLRLDDPERFESEASWNAGDVVQIPEIGRSIYGTYGASFKSLTLSERYSVDASNAGNDAPMPEHGQSLDLGLNAGTGIGDAGWIGVQATYFGSIHDLTEYACALLKDLTSADRISAATNWVGQAGSGPRHWLRSIAPASRHITA